ncbi:hypothetical protein MKY29_18225 [Psychrobacillus sp. FSL K6-2365]|uniref:hypothetical protein n=1 Tax=Psychrobacillus sp. FSL K6-2365 TaxID=2921546 RepID=UPI0030F61948
MLNINLPVELESMEIIQLIESPVVEKLGILIMGEDMDGIPNIRFYELENIEDVFEVKKELQTFTFHSSADAMTFVDHLPDMSALELILMMRTDNINKILH